MGRQTCQYTVRDSLGLRIREGEIKFSWVKNTEHKPGIAAHTWEAAGRNPILNNKQTNKQTDSYTKPRQNREGLLAWVAWK